MIKDSQGSSAVARDDVALADDNAPEDNDEDPNATDERELACSLALERELTAPELTLPEGAADEVPATVDDWDDGAAGSALATLPSENTSCSSCRPSCFITVVMGSRIEDSGEVKNLAGVFLACSARTSACEATTLNRNTPTT